MKTFGSVLKSLRVDSEKNITLTDLAKRTNLSQPFLSMLENDKKVPTTDTLFNIIQELGVMRSETQNTNLSAVDKSLYTLETIFHLMEPIGLWFLDNRADLKSSSLHIIDKRTLDYLVYLESYFKKIDKNSLSLSELSASFPVNYIRSLSTSASKKMPENINERLEYSKFILDLDAFDENFENNIQLKLDGVYLSKLELDILKNYINGIRYSRNNA